MDRIFATLQQGLPVLAEQFALTLALLGVGIACYTMLTPFHEWRHFGGSRNTVGRNTGLECGDARYSALGIGGFGHSTYDLCGRNAVDPRT
jgi:hypothetical protein